MPWAMNSPHFAAHGDHTYSRGVPRVDRGCTSPRDFTNERPLPVSGQGRCAGGAAPARSPAGLVHLETSDTSPAAHPENSPGVRANWNPRDPAQQRRRRHSRMQRATVTGARVLTEGLQAGGFRYRAAFVTVTYAEDAAWRPRHISELVKRYRQWIERRAGKLRLVWTAELTRRGRVHYHLCLWLPKGLSPPMPDKQGWWPHGMTQVQWVRRSAVAYIAKYASKGDKGYSDTEAQPYRFPKGCRIHGRSGLEQAQRRTVSWWCLPKYVREEFPVVGARILRAKGGGWVDADTGAWSPPWNPLSQPGPLSAASACANFDLPS